MGRAITIQRFDHHHVSTVDSTDIAALESVGASLLAPELGEKLSSAILPPQSCLFRDS
mgnify:CR=1 FL=1